MTSLASYVSSPSVRGAVFGKDPSVIYAFAFAALGLFFSAMAAALGLDVFAAAAW